MDIKTHFSEKLSKMLFLEIKKNSKLNNYIIEENIYMPVRTKQVVDEVNNGENLDNIPITFFVEGMFYVLGADKEFKYNSIYKEIIDSIPNSRKHIKGIIFKEIEKKAYEEAYILLKGLLFTEKTTEIYDKNLLLLDSLRIINSIYKDEMLEVIDEAKLISNYAMPYLYEAFIKRDDKDFKGALFSINNYVSNGGNLDKEITEFKNSLELINSYDKGKEMVHTSPKEALQILLSLTEQLGDSAELYYYIAVAYRNLQVHEKAIYYLNEAMAIESDYIEVINEFGINHACLSNYEMAIQYFRKAFEVTQSIEICTNLVMCYLNVGNKEQAKLHLDIAKKLDPKDEVVVKLVYMLE